ncbi:hypothetical protein [Oryzobacter telluris]|uniref:hypothetical protein n=1 Tax=Oryzobacter telluris TaxID=3149179 RepID=UPI00370D3934
MAILTGTAAAAALALASSSWTASTWGVVAATAALAVVGLVDDVRGLAARPRLILQVAVGALGGLAIAGATGAVVGALVTPTAVNMVNFMDGINGICGIHAAVWGASALVAAGRGGGEVLATLGLLSLAGGPGFLPWNLPKARMFLGDVGSYFLGGLAGFGVTAALTSSGGTLTSLAVIGLVCAPYLLFAVDTATALVRRRRAGEPLFEAHRTHVYQRLVNEGALPHSLVSSGMGAIGLLVSAAFLLGWPIGVLTCAVAAVAYLSTPRLILRGAPA